MLKAQTKHSTHMQIDCMNQMDFQAVRIFIVTMFFSPPFVFDCSRQIELMRMTVRDNTKCAQGTHTHTHKQRLKMHLVNFIGKLVSIRIQFAILNLVYAIDGPISLSIHVVDFNLMRFSLFFVLTIPILIDVVKYCTQRTSYGNGQWSISSCWQTSSLNNHFQLKNGHEIHIFGFALIHITSLRFDFQCIQKRNGVDGCVRADN